MFLLDLPLNIIQRDMISTLIYTPRPLQIESPISDNPGIPMRNRLTHIFTPASLDMDSPIAH
jgi:hypothetical protein